MRRPALLAATTLFAAALASPALAIDVSQTVATTAAPDKVWALIGDFDAISKWLPPAASSPSTKGNAVGSVRTITLKAPGDPTIVETLTGYDAAAHTYSYDITAVDPKVLPVIHYHSTITVTPTGAGSTVVWLGSFEAPPGVPNADSEKAVTGTYRAGLDNIKAVTEK
jgi:hypothetical protein